MSTEEADNNPADCHGTWTPGVEAIAKEPAISQRLSEAGLLARSADVA